MKTWFAFRCWSDTPWGHRNQGVGGQLYPPPSFGQKEKQNVLLQICPPRFSFKRPWITTTWPPDFHTFLRPWTIEAFENHHSGKFPYFFSFASFQSLEKRTKFEWCICVLLIHVANFMYNTWKKFAFSSFNFLFLSTDSFWQIMGICYHCLLSSETMSHLCPRQLIHRVDTVS